MNYHVALVHFPVALLTVYAVLEIVRIPWLNKRPGWREVKFVFLLLGTLGSYAAVQTGGMIEHQFTSERSLVRMHSTFAGYTVALFTVLTLMYIITLVEEKWNLSARISGTLGKIWKAIVSLVRLLMRPAPLIVLALAGLALVTITGALGGSIAYGPDVDPVAHFVYHLFF